MKLRTELENRILILDGAMGTMIQHYKLVEADSSWRTFCQNQNSPERK